MINTKLNDLAKKLQAKLKRQNSNFSFSLSQIRDEINKVSTDYDITFEQETIIIDNLINKSQSTIQQKSHCDLTETEVPTVKLGEQTLDNLTETDMNETNNQQQSALTVNNQQSTAITFNDDLDKAIEIRKIARSQAIELNTKQCLEIAEKTQNQFQSNDQFQLEILEYLGLEISKRANQSINKFTEKIEEIKDMQTSYQNRRELLVQMCVNDISKSDAESLEKTKNILKNALESKIIKSE